MMRNRVGKTVLLTVMFAVLFVLPLSARLSAQTAQKVEDLLNQEAVSWAGAAYFALEAAEKAVLDSPDEAFQFASSQSWLPKNIEASSRARLDGISLLLMRAFDLNGGLFYTLTKNSHYSYRELVYKKVIQGKTDPEMAVSGQEFLFMISRILAIKEADLEKLAEEINAQLESQHISGARANVTTEGVTISITNIQFLANSAELTDPEKDKIREIAEILKTVHGQNLLVAGHTALAGTSADQMQTSIERAEAVADYLVSLGVRNREEIVVQGHGADRPIADNATAEGMALNRRVEITILLRAGNR